MGIPTKSSLRFMGKEMPLMRILVISNLYPPHYIGGYELACRDVAEALRKRGHEIKVLTSTYGLPFDEQDTDVHRILRLYGDFYSSPEKPISKKVFEAFNYFTTNDLLLSFNPDVVYAWSLSNISLAPVVAAEEMGFKVVHHIFDYSLFGLNL